MKYQKTGLLLVILFTVIMTRAQGNDDKIVKPILVDKSVLSGVGLEKVTLKDEPEKDFYQKRIYRGEELSVYVVSTETWNNKMNDFPFDEFIYMFHGEALVKPEKGESILFHSGEYFFAPKGYTGEWEIRAGSNLHYELSVISTKRTDSIKVSSDVNHTLFSKSILSGAQINFDAQDKYSEVLKKGVELTVSLKAEKPTVREMSVPTREELIQILSGQITLQDSANNEESFFTGDFLIIPKGFIGNWKSEGHGLVKYLTVEKTL